MIKTPKYTIQSKIAIKSHSKKINKIPLNKINKKKYAKI
jgi:hypothetical protein